MTTLVRWEPLRELASVQTEMSRLMNGLLEGPGRVTQSWVPALDVWETETEVVYAFDLPGIPEEAISIEVGFYRFERRFGTFARAVGLPQGVDQDQISARYDNGVLEVRVPKPEDEKPRKIELRKTLNA